MTSINNGQDFMVPPSQDFCFDASSNLPFIKAHYPILFEIQLLLHICVCQSNLSYPPFVTVEAGL